MLELCDWVVFVWLAPSLGYRLSGSSGQGRDALQQRKAQCCDFSIPEYFYMGAEGGSAQRKQLWFQPLAWCLPVGFCSCYFREQNRGSLIEISEVCFW